jgi:Ca2+-binding RTX toxin-like protein
MSIEFSPVQGSPFDVDAANNQFAFGDFNKDGIVDKLVIESIFDSDEFTEKTKVSVLLGDKKGEFKATNKTLEISGGPKNIQIGNFDADGNLDAVVWTSFYNSSNYSTYNKVSVLKGNKKGNFKLETEVDLGEQVSDVTFKDVDNNGLDDLSAKSYSSVDVWLAKKGKFTPAKNSPFDINTYNPVVIGDFNKDGFLDKATAESVYDYDTYTSSTKVSVQLGKKNGQFKPVNFSIDIEGYSTDISLGNFDGDGNLDLAVQSSSYNYYSSGKKVSLLLGDGKGEFSQSEVDLEEQGNPTITDINNDKLDDLQVATSSYSYGQIQLSLGTKNGNFKPGPTIDLENPNAIAAGDLDNDGNQDLVVVSGYGEDTKIQVLYGDSDGKFEPGINIETDDIAPNDVAIVDLNGDGKLDIKLTESAFNESYGSISKTSVILGKANRKFGAASTPLEVKADTNIAVGYFNGDKKLDAVVTKNSYESYGIDEQTSVLLGTGTGKLKAGQEVKVENPKLFAEGDVNGDGKLDLVAVTSSTNPDTLVTENSLEVFLGNGKGKLNQKKQSTIKLDEPVEEVVTGDFDGDGNLDVAVASSSSSYYYYPYYGSSSSKVSVFLGKGNGTFKEAKNSPYELDNTNAFALGDFNGDGKVDIAEINPYSYQQNTTVSVLLNQGKNEVKSAKTYTLKEGEENLLLTGNKKINGTGNELDNEITGNKNNNILSGLDGDDILNGGNGNDRLDGGAGDDTLTGGIGKDRFEFDSNAPFSENDLGVDTITDFKSSQKDKIVLSQTTFDVLASDTGSGFSVIAEFEAKAFADISAVESSEAFIVYDKNTGELFYNPNGSDAGFGNGGAFAILEGAPALKASDFVIVA